jgi:hypothetical protein
VAVQAPSASLDACNVLVSGVVGTRNAVGNTGDAGGVSVFLLAGQGGVSHSLLAVENLIVTNNTAGGTCWFAW